MSTKIQDVIVHASCVALERAGILILGPSGAGKSDLALRLIHDGARLVADDRTRLTPAKGALIASAPDSIAGLIEIRGLGIIALPAKPARLALVVQLGREDSRLPEPRFWTPRGLKGVNALPLIALDGRHASDPAKIAAAVKAFSKNLFRDTFVLKEKGANTK